jgi:hypothetical protein
MEKCFVIQPFDNDKFDKRYADVFEPAITNAGLSAYRVDKDLAVRIPIDEIEKGIFESAFCFADITIDNPNVWYELGYAFACHKDVIIVCSEERQKFPFDIQHRQIIIYKIGSISDFNALGEKITKKIRALQTTSKTVKQLTTTPVIETEGLKSHEIALLILMMEDQIDPEEGTAYYHLKNEMTKAGYTDIATAVGIKTLIKLEMVKTYRESGNWSNEDYVACRMTEKGENWILLNQNQLQFRQPIIESKSDDLPF